MSNEIATQAHNPFKALLAKAADATASQLDSAFRREDITRGFIVAAASNPGIKKCSPSSVALAMLQCADLDMAPGAHGHVYLVPYGNNLQAQVGYKGLIELARRSGQVRKFAAGVVYEGDEFEYENGFETVLRHKRKGEERDDRLTHAWAAVVLTNGERVFEVISRAEIDKTRKRSKGRGGPWETDFPKMARKTAIKRLLSGGLVPLTEADAGRLARVVEAEERDDVLDAEPVEAPSLAELVEGGGE